MIDAAGGRFVYCSTLATYLYSLDGFKLEKLIAVHEVWPRTRDSSPTWPMLTPCSSFILQRTITGLSFNPSNPNQFVTCALDMRLLKYDVSDEKEMAFAKVTQPPSMVDWSVAPSVFLPLCSALLCSALLCSALFSSLL